MRSREEIEDSMQSVTQQVLNGSDSGIGLLLSNQLLLEAILDLRELFIEGNCECDSEYVGVQMMENEQN